MAFRPRLHSTREGASDSALKELTVVPTACPSALRAVMMVTPVANCPSASRNSRCEKGSAVRRTEVGRAEFTTKQEHKMAATQAHHRVKNSRHQHLQELRLIIGLNLSDHDS